MDPERRPESDETALYTALRRTPEFLRDYGFYLVVGLGVFAAVLWIYRSRTQSALIEQQAASQGLFNLVSLVEDAQQLAALTPVMSPSQVQAQVADLDEQFKQFSPLVADSPVEGAVAHSLRLRGDFAWNLATMPPGMAAEPSTAPTTGPTTAPAERDDIASLLNDRSREAGPAPGAAEPRPSEEWLEESAAAYQQVLDRFPEQNRDVIAARFGLAAIAEQRGEFDVARGEYEAIIAMDAAPQSVVALARERQELLQHLALKVRLASPATRPADDSATGGGAVEPTTQPAGDGEPAGEPATQPSTRPTTAPVG